MYPVGKCVLGDDAKIVRWTEAVSRYSGHRCVRDIRRTIALSNGPVRCPAPDTWDDSRAVVGVTIVANLRIACAVEFENRHIVTAW